MLYKIKLTFSGVSGGPVRWSDQCHFEVSSCSTSFLPVLMKLAVTVSKVFIQSQKNLKNDEKNHQEKVQQFDVKWDRAGTKNLTVETEARDCEVFCQLTAQPSSWNVTSRWRKCSWAHEKNRWSNKKTQQHRTLLQELSSTWLIITEISCRCVRVETGSHIRPAHPAAPHPEFTPSNTQGTETGRETAWKQSDKEW